MSADYCPYQQVRMYKLNMFCVSLLKAIGQPVLKADWYRYVWSELLKSNVETCNRLNMTVYLILCNRNLTFGDIFVSLGLLTAF